MGATLSAITVDGDDAVDLAAVLPPDARSLFDATTAANTAVNVAGSASVSAHLRLQELFAASAVVYDSRPDATRLLERDDWAEVAAGRAGGGWEGGALEGGRERRRRSGGGRRRGCSHRQVSFAC